MLRIFLFLLASAFATAAFPAELPASAEAAPNIGFAIIKTAKLPVQEALIYDGGRWTQKVDSNFSAFLIKHGDSTLLFDAGLSSKVGEQYRQDMPLWQRAFFKYEGPVSPARDQLAARGMAQIKTIILSHSHWDHASGIGDFPGATVWVSSAEMDVIRHPSTGVGGAWPSQIATKETQWKILQLQPVAYEVFDSSLDLFQDGSVVLVSLSGHTPGSIGLFLRGDSGRRYFFVGDAVWSARALQSASPKFWAARMLVDGDRDKTLAVIRKIQALIQRHPDIIVIPAHGAGFTGIFPKVDPVAFISQRNLVLVGSLPKSFSGGPMHLLCR